MSRLAVLLTVAAFWLCAYLVGGWWGVALMAAVGFLGELLLFGVSHRALWGIGHALDVELLPDRDALVEAVAAALSDESWQDPRATGVPLPDLLGDSILYHYAADRQPDRGVER